MSERWVEAEMAEFRTRILTFRGPEQIERVLRHGLTDTEEAYMDGYVFSDVVTGERGHVKQLVMKFKLADES